MEGLGRQMRSYIYIHIFFVFPSVYVPGTQMTPIFQGQPPHLGSRYLNYLYVIM